MSTFDELRTPNSHEFGNFKFQLPEETAPPKPVEGPVGPHLFRLSQGTSQDVDFYLSMSPAASPHSYRAGPTATTNIYLQPEPEKARISTIPLRAWTPRQVIGWMIDVGFEDSLVEKFCSNDISGAILQDLQFGDLKELGVHSFGQRHQLWNEIRRLRGSGLVASPVAAVQEGFLSPIVTQQLSVRAERSPDCSNPATPEAENGRSPTMSKRRARRARRADDDIISPAESASIVAIEQLMPKPHHCSKGENCSKWQKQQRKLAEIAKEFPLELRQIGEASASPTETTLRPASEAVPSVVASSDLLGPGSCPTLRLDERHLKVVQSRDPQENVRQFLSFQHVASPEEPTTPPYEMFPPLSPPGNTQAPHGNLRGLPRLTIPDAPPAVDAFSPDRTVIRQARSPVTAMEMRDRNASHDIYRYGSPASAMDMPLTAIPLGPVARDESQSVPPDMRFGAAPISRSSSGGGHRPQQFEPIFRPQTCAPSRSTSRVSQRRQPSFAMPSVEERKERVLTPINGADELTPTATDVNHAGWMKKRKTKMLRHEWHENHFRLNGTRLAMHRDSRDANVLEAIDVDEYAVACSTLASNKLGAAFKSLKISGKRKDEDPAAFSFQLVPAAEKKGILHAATGKTHHFAVKTRDERIDWMRELMLAKAMRQKSQGCQVNVNGNAM